MSELEEALGRIDRAAIAQLAGDMIDIPSPVGGEGALAHYLAGRFRDAGLRTWMQEVEPGRHNVFGLIEGAGGGPTLMYGGHLDSAYAGDEDGIRELGPGYQPKSWMEGDWIFGLGAFNMKCGHAAAILAVESMARAGIRMRGDLMICGVVGETCHVNVGRFQGSRYRGCGVGARHMLANGLSADMVVMAEPTNSKISVASGGYIYFELTTQGNPGSTFRRKGWAKRPNFGRDAIEKMLDVIPSLRKWGDAHLANTRYEGEQAGNVNIIAIEGGHPFRPTKRPCLCHLYFEVGLTPGQDQADIVQSVRDVTRKLRQRDEDMQVDVKVLQTALPAEVSPDEYIVRALARSHEEVWGSPAEVTWTGWYADTAPLTRADIPSVCYGPQGRMIGGESYYPKEGEHANVLDLAQGARVFVRTAYDVCNSDRAALKARRAANRFVAEAV